MPKVGPTIKASATIRASNTIFPSPFYGDFGLNYWNTSVSARQAPYTATLSATLGVSAQINWATGGQSMTITDFLIEVLHPGP